MYRKIVVDWYMLALILNWKVDVASIQRAYKVEMGEETTDKFLTFDGSEENPLNGDSRYEKMGTLFMDSEGDIA